VKPGKTLMIHKGNRLKKGDLEFHFRNMEFVFMVLSFPRIHRSLLLKKTGLMRKMIAMSWLSWEADL
jgi:hypothetical protein